MRIEAIFEAACPVLIFLNSKHEMCTDDFLAARDICLVDYCERFREVIFQLLLFSFLSDPW